MLVSLMAFAILCQVAANPENPATFSISTDILVDGSAGPAVNRVTIIGPTSALDFDPKDASKVVFYDLQRGDIIKLDFMSREKSTVTAQVLSSLMTEVVAGLSQQQRLAFGVDAAAKQLGSNLFVTEANGWKYEIQGQPSPTVGGAQRYAAFANMASRLNVLERQGPPPFARMRLNDLLATHDQIPATAVRTGGVSIKTVHKITPGEASYGQPSIQSLQAEMTEFTESPWIPK